jgi:mannitol-1-phosphate/altronate dehydrogenase
MQTSFQDVLTEDSFISIKADETLKLRLQNASLTMLAYPAFLAGYRTVNEAMQDSLFTDYVSAFIDQDVSPLHTASTGIDLDSYKSELLSEFTNPATTDPLASLCCDGTSKLSDFVLPTLRELLEKNRDVHRIAFLLAAYGHYLAVSRDDNGAVYEVNDPHLHHDDWAKITSSDVVSLLAISPLASARLQTFSYFVALYKSYRAQIATLGVVFLLKQMAYHRLAMR